MRSRLLLPILVFLSLISLSAAAQDDAGDPIAVSTTRPDVQNTPQAETVERSVRTPRAEVQVESALVRALPLPDGEHVASVFESEILEVVGRNLDGLWFEVRRPGRLTSLGWIFNEMLDWDFAPELLPLTDTASGATGGEVLDADPGFAAYLLENANLRRLPLIESERFGVVPVGSTVPVLARNQDGSWVYVYYLGIEGWVSNYSTRAIANVLDLPVAPGLPPLPTANIIVIPPEIQRAQLDRLRGYVTVQREFAANLAAFWFSVSRGQVMPCEPPPFVVDYLYSAQDVRELPELQRYVPRLETAAFSLNVSIELLTVCGAFDPHLITTARNNAINAENIYTASLGAIENLEGIIR